MIPLSTTLLSLLILCLILFLAMGGWSLDWPTAAVILGLAGLYVYHSTATASHRCACHECTQAALGRYGPKRAVRSREKVEVEEIPFEDPVEGVMRREVLERKEVVAPTGLHVASAETTVARNIPHNDANRADLAGPLDHSAIEFDHAVPEPVIHQAVEVRQNFDQSFHQEEAAPSPSLQPAPTGTTQPNGVWTKESEPTEKPLAWADYPDEDEPAYYHEEEHVPPVAIPRKPRAPLPATTSWPRHDHVREDAPSATSSSSSQQSPSSTSHRDLPSLSASKRAHRLRLMAKYGEYECTLCSLFFPTPQLFQEHTRALHTDGIAKLPERAVRATPQKHRGALHNADLRPYQCAPCDRFFKTEKFLAQHLRDKHGGTAQREESDDGWESCPGFTTNVPTPEEDWIDMPDPLSPHSEVPELPDIHNLPDEDEESPKTYSNALRGINNKAEKEEWPSLSPTKAAMRLSPEKRAKPLPPVAENINSAVLTPVPSVSSEPSSTSAVSGTPSRNVPTALGTPFEATSVVAQPTASFDAFQTPGAKATVPDSPASATSSIFAFTPTPHKFIWSRDSPGKSSTSSLFSPSRPAPASTASTSPTSPTRSPTSPTSHSATSPTLSRTLFPDLERTFSSTSSSSSASIWGPPENARYAAGVIPPVPAVSRPDVLPGWENWPLKPESETRPEKRQSNSDAWANSNSRRVSAQPLKPQFDGWVSLEDAAVARSARAASPATSVSTSTSHSASTTTTRGASSKRRGGRGRSSTPNTEPKARWMASNETWEHTPLPASVPVVGDDDEYGGW